MSGSTRSLSAWLLKRERAAGLPKLAGGVSHPIERERSADAGVPAVGGVEDTRQLYPSYQQAERSTLLKTVEQSVQGRTGARAAQHARTREPRSSKGRRGSALARGRCRTRTYDLTNENRERPAR